MKSNTLLQQVDGCIKVLALTGIRSEYDLFYPLLQELHQDESFDVGVICAGAHLTPLHNFSVRQVEEDGFRIAERIENLIYSNSVVGKVKSAAVLLEGLAQTLKRERPHLLLVLGDREEPLVGAMAGNYMNIPVVHLAGGDNTAPIDGDVDEQVRHATTKLSNVHLTMAEEHTARLIKMGEEPWRVFTVGSGGIDRLRAEKRATLDELAEIAGSEVRNDYLVLIYHALSSELTKAKYEIATCIQAGIESGLTVFIGAPNSDPGFQDILDTIKEFVGHPKVKLYSNLPRNAFLTFLRNAKCLFGNSSLAFHEAGFLGLPAINVGERQRGRLCGNNVQFVDAVPGTVKAAIHKALYDDQYLNEIKSGGSVYGDGFMAQKSAKILKQLPGTKALLAKKITY
jgi:GDP/UDP-N,N'-diacetylbacillosamine 2-epimerase (hydrolysing)